MVQEYIKNFEKLFLDRRQKIQAKDFLEAERFHSREKNIIDELVAENYLSECGDKWYSLGEEALNLLRKETYRWEALQQEKIFLEKQFHQEIMQYLKNIFFHSVESLDIKDILEVDRVDAKKKEFISELVEEQYLEESPEDNKSCKIGEKGWELLKQNAEIWESLLRKKEQKQKIKWRDFLKYIEINGGLTVDIKKQYSFELESGLERDFIENQGQKYSLTTKGEHFLYTLRPAAEVLQDLQNEYSLFKNKYFHIEKIILQQHDSLVKNLENMEQNLLGKFSNLYTKLENTHQEFKNIEKFVAESEIAHEWKNSVTGKIEKALEEYHFQQENLKTKWLNEQKKLFEIHNELLEKQKSKTKEQQDQWNQEAKKIETLYQNIHNILQHNEVSKKQIENISLDTIKNEVENTCKNKQNNTDTLEPDNDNSLHTTSKNTDTSEPKSNNSLNVVKENTSISEPESNDSPIEQDDFENNTTTNNDKNDALENVENIQNENQNNKIEYDDTIKELEKKFNESINRTYKSKLDSDNETMEEAIKIKEEVDTYIDDIPSKNYHSKDFIAETPDFNNYDEYPSQQFDSDYIPDEEALEDNNEILEEISKYYKLTYFRHRGSLKLSFLLDHLENELTISREEAKLQIKRLYKEGSLTLDATKEVAKYDMKNIICDGANFYYALHIEAER